MFEPDLSEREQPTWLLWDHFLEISSPLHKQPWKSSAPNKGEPLELLGVKDSPNLNFKGENSEIEKLIFVEILKLKLDCEKLSRKNDREEDKKVLWWL